MELFVSFFAFTIGGLVYHLDTKRDRRDFYMVTYFLLVFCLATKIAEVIAGL